MTSDKTPVIIFFGGEIMRRYLKVFTLLLTLVMLGGIFAIAPSQVSASGKKFSDVDLKPSSDGYKAIYWAVDKGVTTGIKNTDKFAPEDACTRAQAVTFIWRLAGKPSPKTGKSAFSDIDSKFKKDRPEMYKAILWATEKKIVAGYSDGSFRPNTKCSRAHIVTFLYRYAGKPGFSNYSKQKSPFTDVKTSIGKDMYPAILWAKDKGVTTGISGTKKFDPKGTCTRKQIVTFLWRYDGKSAAKPTATPTATATPSPVPNGKDTTPYEEIKLDGVKEHTYTSKDYCYLESDKYVLFLEKGLTLPGDFKVNLDAIVDEIEDQLGISSCPKDFQYPKFGNMWMYDPDEDGNYPEPWKDWDIGTKIPVMIDIDEKGIGYTSGACAEYTTLYLWGLVSDESWETIPFYKNRPELRGRSVEYVEIAHELTHTITLRNRNLTKILAEGIADYSEEAVIFALADRYPSIKAAKDEYNWEDDTVPEAVNADNAERIFIEDYHDLSHAHRGAEDVFGSYIFKYLREKVGDDFYRKYNDKLIANGVNNNNYGTYDKKMVTAYADTLKEVGGKDFFTGFGAWCVEKNVLQNVGHWVD